MPINGGKVICAWMRLADVLGADALYLGLFRLATGRIQGYSVGFRPEANAPEAGIIPGFRR
jgi:hypothetical protein